MNQPERQAGILARLWLAVGPKVGGQFAKASKLLVKLANQSNADANAIMTVGLFEDWAQIICARFTMDGEDGAHHLITEYRLFCVQRGSSSVADFRAIENQLGQVAARPRKRAELTTDDVRCPDAVREILSFVVHYNDHAFAIMLANMVEDWRRAIKS